MSNPLDTLRHNLQILAENDVDMLIEKGRHYGDSWKKRGGPGAYMVMARKMDRLENIAKKANYDIFAALAKKLDGDEQLLDTIRDLRGYLYLIEEEYLARQRGGRERDLEETLLPPPNERDLRIALRETISSIMGGTPGQFTGVRNPDHMRINVDIRTFCVLDTGPGGWAEAMERQGLTDDGSAAPPASALHPA